MQAAEYDVLVVGAGPVGLTLAIDLGRRGVRCLLVEQLEAPSPWPKFDRCNARTMEIFRRLGLADRIRALGYPADAPMDVFVVTRLSDAPLVHLRYPSVAERRARIAATADASEPCEPYQLVSQNRIEPLLKEVAEATAGVTVRYGTSLIGFEQDGDGVTARLLSSGDPEEVRVRYLAGCDGGRSLVRSTLGVELDGEGGTRTVTQICFRSDELYDRIPIGRGRHYTFADAEGSTLVVQGNRIEFTLNSNAGDDIDPVAFVMERIGFDCPFQVEHVGQWKRHLLLAKSYGRGRVYIAGDAAHQVIPTGGLGMNTGVGDAIDLAWKLAGTIAGWGGPDLLASYEIERHRVGERNREASGWASQGVVAWRMKLDPARIAEESAEGQAMRAALADAARAGQRRMHEMVGVEIGYSYAGSPLIYDEPGNRGDWDIIGYDPSPRPGVRIPHVWLSDGRAIQDVLGRDYSLLDLSGGAQPTGRLEAAFRAAGAPLDVVRLDEPHVAEVYGCSLLLLRPDLHIVWRGSHLPVGSDDLAAIAIGCGSIRQRRLGAA